MKETRATDGELMQGSPAARRSGAIGEKIGDNGRDVLGALVFPAEIAYERREFGADAGKASPVPGIVFELKENVENKIVGEH